MLSLHIVFTVIAVFKGLADGMRYNRIIICICGYNIYNYRCDIIVGHILYNDDKIA